MAESPQQPPIKKCQQAITDAQKKELREWAHDESHGANGKLLIQACIK